ncbi:VDAC2 protein, partial [Polypterus senegalus]
MGKMAVPPSYSDLGKSARDIFNKGYGFGLVKLEVKTKSASGVEFATSGSSNTDTNKVIGSLETKYKWAEYGLTFTEKWNTDNTLGTEITIEDQIAKGLKLNFDTTFSPNTGKKSGKVKTAYKREYVNLGWDVDFDFAGSAIHDAAVVGYEGSGSIKIIANSKTSSWKSQAQVMRVICQLRRTNEKVEKIDIFFSKCSKNGKALPNDVDTTKAQEGAEQRRLPQKVGIMKLCIHIINTKDLIN